jgi:hypothetical protein
MAMRAAMMSSMSSLDSPATVQESDGLFRKLVLLLLLISAAVLWIVIWFEYETIFPLLLSTFFADISLGVTAGLGSRFVVRNREWVERYLVGILVAVVGMSMLGYLTHWVLGIGPIHLEEKFAEQVQEIHFSGDLSRQVRSLGIGSRVLFDFTQLDWADLVHLSISLGVLVLSMQAWRRPVTSLAPVPEPVEIIPLPVIAPAVTPSRVRGRRVSSTSNGRARFRRADSSANHSTLGPSASPQPRVRSNNGSRPSIKKVKEPTVRPKKKKASRRKPKIQFALVEEHRCPYCLDNVTRTDPRGVKECEVCHTLHHADCWAITGVCQVPHLNT